MITLDLNDLSWLQKWYSQHCNGEWEHASRIHIYSIDNPGWRVKIDLSDTSLAGKTLNKKIQEHSDSNWIHYWVKDNIFEAAGGAENLSEILNIFRKWAGQAISL